MRPFNLLRAAIALAAIGLLAGCKQLVVLFPAGDIAAQQGRLIIVATVLIMLVVGPVMFLVALFAWRYRQNGKATETEYDPEWNHSTKLELIIWAAPLMVIIALGALTWITTHKLDPYRPLDRISEDKPLSPDVKPLEVEVVSMDWKWLFFYPEEGIAVVNELAAPVDRPIRFKLTSTHTMNAFYVPDLAGMVYTMPGMETQLNAVINKPGIYKGMSSHYSGSGFAGMTFKFHGLSNEDFESWVAKAKAGGEPLSRDTYRELAEPSERNPVQLFSSVEDKLYERILNRCLEDGQTCMYETMAQDASKTRANAMDQTKAVSESRDNQSPSIDPRKL